MLPLSLIDRRKEIDLAEWQLGKELDYRVDISMPPSWIDETATRDRVLLAEAKESSADPRL